MEKLDKELQEKERHAASVMFSTPATDHSHSIQSSSQGDHKENSHAEELIRYLQSIDHPNIHHVLENHVQVLAHGVGLAAIEFMGKWILEEV